MRWSLAVCALVPALALNARGAGFTANQLYVQSTVSTSVEKFEPTVASPGYASAGSFPTNPGTFVAFGPGNLLYLCSGTGVRILNETGTVVDTITGGGLSAANGLVFGPGGDLFVVSNSTVEIMRYRHLAGAWSFQSKFTLSGMTNATGLALSPDGSLYTCDEDAGKVFEFDISGKAVRNFTTGNSLDQPRSLAFGPNGQLYVAMSTAFISAAFDNDHVFVFSAAGVKVNDIGNGTGIDRPAGIAFGPNGNLFVSASGTTDEVFEFDPVTGNKITQFGSGHLDSPFGLAFVPHRFKAKLSGLRASPNDSAKVEKESVFLDVAPGSRTILIEMKDTSAEGTGFVATFVQEALVFHGFESAEDAGAKKRVFGGAQIGNFAEGVGSASLTVSGKPDKFGDYLIKEVSGSVGRHGASGGYDAELSTGKFLNKP